MKKILLLIVLCLGLLSLSFAAEVKIGVVKMDRIIQESNELAEISRIYKLDMQNWKNQLNELDAQIKQMEQEFEIAKLTKTEAAKREAQAKIDEKKAEAGRLLEEYFGEGGKSEQRYMELLSPINTKINNIIKKIATDEGYTIIFDDSMGTVLYSAPSIDITDLVLLELNKDTVKPTPDNKTNTTGTQTPKPEDTFKPDEFIPKKMKKFNKTITPEDIVAVCGGEYHGEQNITLQSVADPEEADSSSVIFWEQEKYLDAVKKSPAVLIFCHPDKANNLPNRNLILHPHPYFAFLRLVDWWIEQDAEKPIPEIHPTAIIDSSATIGDGVYIGPYCIIGKNCQIGNDSIFEAHCFISNDVSIGKNTHLYPNVNIYADTRIGNGVIIHSGTVIGADGFGFILMDGVQNKIPQVGNVVIEDFVEIQANSAVDRGTLSSTFIGQGTKIDNFVQIGHNCRIGKHCILCAQVGLAGSTILGDYVYLAGQVGVAGHLKIGDRAMVGAQSGITNDIPADARYWGSPAMEADRFKRILVSQKHLPEIYRFYLKQKKKEEEET